MFAITGVMLQATVKVVHGEGVSLGTIWIFRNALLPIFSLLLMGCRNPFAEWPEKKKHK